VYTRQMFVCKVRRLLSQFRYLKDANLYASRPHNSSSSTIHTAVRFLHCCILLSVKRWFKLNRARVAHDARPALSSYQNKCSKPGQSHHNSDICNLWSLVVLLICLHYNSTDWNLGSGQRRRPISNRPTVGQYQLLLGPYGGLCVLQCGLGLCFSLH